MIETTAFLNTWGEGKKELPCPEQVRFAAGAGMIPAGEGEMLGGWADITCRLLLYKRFCLHHGSELREGLKPEEILTLVVRRILAEVFRKESQAGLSGPSSPELWRRCREGTEEALLNAGWDLEGFDLHTKLQPCRTGLPGSEEV